MLIPSWDKQGTVRETHGMIMESWEKTYCVWVAVWQRKRLGLCLKKGNWSEWVIVAQFVSDSETPWTDHQAPLFMEFYKQENWSGLPFPSPKATANAPNLKILTLVTNTSQLQRHYWLSKYCGWLKIELALLPLWKQVDIMQECFWEEQIEMIWPENLLLWAKPYQLENELLFKKQQKEVDGV